MPVLRDFFKYEGLGNDFLLFEGGAVPSAEEAAALCDRRRGVGGDGVLVLLPPRTLGAVARMHVTNADGSVPQMCGNAIRCVGVHLVAQGTASAGAPFLVDTDAGPKQLVVEGDRVAVDMGPARLDVPAQFPPLRRAPLEAAGRTWTATTVSMGNPHVVVEAAPDRVAAAEVGPILERDPRFPERINVELAALADDGAIDVVVWERGVGLTDACGTGACAAAVAFAEAGLVPRGRDVDVRLPGGMLRIGVPADPAAGVVMTGPARLAYAGRVDAEALRGAADALRRRGGAPPR